MEPVTAPPDSKGLSGNTSIHLPAGAHNSRQRQWGTRQWMRLRIVFRLLLMHLTERIALIQPRQKGPYVTWMWAIHTHEASRRPGPAHPSLVVWRLLPGKEAWMRSKGLERCWTETQEGWVLICLSSRLTWGVLVRSLGLSHGLWHWSLSIVKF